MKRWSEYSKTSEALRRWLGEVNLILLLRRLVKRQVDYMTEHRHRLAFVCDGWWTWKILKAVRELHVRVRCTNKNLNQWRKPIEKSNISWVRKYVTLEKCQRKTRNFWLDIHKTQESALWWNWDTEENSFHTFSPLWRMAWYQVSLRLFTIILTLGGLLSRLKHAYLMIILRSFEKNESPRNLQKILSNGF